MRTPSIARGVALAVVLVALAAPAIAAGAVKDTHVESPFTGAPWGASDHTTFSQDSRSVGYMAFDSTGPAGGKRDVWLVRRDGGEGNLAGSLIDVTTALRGDSTNPSLSGEGSTAARCVVFENRGVYMAGVDGKGRPRRIARSGSGPVVDGQCEFVVYQRGSRIMLWERGGGTCRVGRGSDPDLQTNGKGAAYVRGGGIYYRAWTPSGCTHGRLDADGHEVRVDTPRRGAPGAGESMTPALDDNGYYVVFASTRQNLCAAACAGSGGPGDRNGAVRDVFRRTLSSKAPSHDDMERPSYSCGARTQGSGCPVDAYANGPSGDPQISGAGEYVIFDSAATNLRESPAIQSIDPNGAQSDIFVWNFPRERLIGNVSRESRYASPLRADQFFDGASTRPSLSGRGNYMGFTGDFLSGGAPARPAAGLDASCVAGGCPTPNVFMRFAGGSDEGYATG